VVIVTSLPDVSDNDVVKVLIFARLGEQPSALSKPGVDPRQKGLELLDRKLRARRRMTMFDIGPAWLP
jgi:hypothetical protein